MGRNRGYDTEPVYSFWRSRKVTVMRDRREISKGFGFVEMPNGDEGKLAVEGLNRTLLLDRTLDISESVPPAGKGSRNKIKSRPPRFKGSFLFSAGS